MLSGFKMSEFCLQQEMMEHALESVRSSIYSPFCTVASKTGRAHNFASMHA
jgi:hypothetical protein